MPDDPNDQGNANDQEPTLGLDDRIRAYLAFRTGRDYHDGGNVEKLREMATTDEGRRTGAKELLAEHDAEQRRLEDERAKAEAEKEAARLTDERERIKAEVTEKLKVDADRIRRESLEAEVRAELEAEGINPDDPTEVALLHEFGERSTAFNTELKRLKDAQMGTQDATTLAQLRDEIEKLIDEEGPRLDEISQQLSTGRGVAGRRGVDPQAFNEEFEAMFR